MKNFTVLFACFLAAAPVWAEQAQDSLFTRALNDEMKRTQKELRLKGSPAPFFIGYYLFDQTQQTLQAAFGQTVWPFQQNRSLQGAVLLSAGNAQNDSWGLNEKSFVQYERDIPRSYAGIRQALWGLTDRAYIADIDAYDTKQAFKRNKHISENLPDFTPAQKVTVSRPLSAPDFMTEDEMTALAQQLSAWGKDKPFIENFTVTVTQSHSDSFYLNNEGSCAEQSDAHTAVSWHAKLRNKAGYVQVFNKTVKFVRFNEQAKAEIAQISQQFREKLEQAYTAQKATSYLGPVLLKPAAAAWLLNRVFVQNITNLKPLLDTTEQQGGNFRDKTGKRVMSKLVTVYDKPSLHEYNNQPLSFTGTLDDEGVPAQDLVLAQGGKIKELPRSRRPREKNARSNGHGFSSAATYSFPREDVTNVWVQAVDPQTAEQLEAQLLAKCREADLEYCYIIDALPTILNAQRLYTADGHKENVFGLILSPVTTRALRDIIAAGNDMEVTAGGKIVTPSLLLEELEFTPDTAEPEKQPFVPRP